MSKDKHAAQRAMGDDREMTPTANIYIKRPALHAPELKTNTYIWAFVKSALFWAGKRAGVTDLWSAHTLPRCSFLSRHIHNASRFLFTPNNIHEWVTRLHTFHDFSKSALWWDTPRSNRFYSAMLQKAFYLVTSWLPWIYIFLVQRAL